MATTKETPEKGTEIEEEPEVEESSTEETEVTETETETAKLTAEELAEQLSKTRLALKKANAESATRRKALAEFERQKKEKEDAELTELEKLRKDLQEKEQALTKAQAELKVNRLRRAFETKAAELEVTFTSPQAQADAWAFVNQDELTIDDETGSITGVDAAIKALQKSRPYLFGTPGSAPDIDATRKGRSSSTVSEAEITKSKMGRPEYRGL